jgi:DNA polymerase-3 subunit gamma/tau
MAYQVIARKYRPQRFADVVGQEHVTQTLANAITQGRIAHAYLFCGPRGTGKTTLARIFAKGLNCTGGPKVEFDDDDPRVREITEGRSLDVLEIDGASNNGVEQVRELRETARFAPAASKFKIYIIDEVHMLSTAAFNALLKTLEEPPPHVKFFFATTDPEKVLPTILSRCQRFDLRRIPAALIVKHLAWIAQQEGVEIDDAALHAIARGADGGMRDAESTLDQLISFCDRKIVENDVLSMFGLAARGQLLDLTGAILAGQTETVLRTLDVVARNGKDLGRLLSDLLNHFRNLLLFQVSNGDRELLEVSDAEFATLGTQAKQIDIEALTRVLEVLTTAEGRQRDAASRRIFLEVTLIKAIQARGAMSLDSVLQQLRALRDSEPTQPGAAATRGAPAAPDSPARGRPADVPAMPSTPVVSPAPTPVPIEASAVTHTPGAPEVAILWPALLAALGPMQRHCFEQARPTSLSKGVLTIAFPAASDEFELASSKETTAAVQAKLRELGAGDVNLKFVRSEAIPAPTGQEPVPPSNAPPPPRPAVKPPPPPETKPARPAAVLLNKDDFLNDPLIKQALEIFKGRIVEVRGPATGDAPA